MGDLLMLLISNALRDVGLEIEQKWRTNFLKIFGGLKK